MKDPSEIQESKTSTSREVNYRKEMEAYFSEGKDSVIEKLQNFSKYVPRQTLTTFLSKYELFKKILHVQGSIVECGVYLGGGLMTFAQLSSIFEPINHQRKIIGFDTFEGFSELTSGDKTSISENIALGGLSKDSYEDIKESIKLYDENRFLSHIPKVELVRGDICDTLPIYLEKNPHTTISMLYLDMDIEKPTIAAIKAALPRMPKGAVIVFDELNSKKWPGETLAVMKTLGINNLRIQRFPFDTELSYAVIE